MAISFDEADIEEFRDCFSLYARERVISSKEQLTTIMRSLAFSPTIAEAEKFYLEHSKNGKLDFATFITILEKHSKVEKCQKDIIEAFQAQDPGNSGMIPAKDLKTLLTKFGDKLSESEVDRLFKESGVSGPNVKYEDIINCLLSPLPEY